MKRLLFLSLLSPFVTTSVAETKPDVKTPNPDILFLFVDDMTYDGVCAIGNREVITPNMDRIVDQGVCFSNTHNMGGWNGALSMASRTQLMTGKFLWNAFAEQNRDKFDSIIEEQRTWPQVITNGGYKSYHTGKWHVSGVDPADIYDEVEVARPGMPNDNRNTTGVGYNRPLSPEDNSWLPWDKSMGGFWEGGKHWSEVQADLIIAYMERNQDSDKPLFMTCAFNAPHDPRQSPEGYTDKYPVEQIAVPKSFQPEHPYMEQMRSGKEVRDEQLAPWPRTEYAVQKHTQEYYAIITHLDEQIGRILEALESSGRADNTLIILTADNGLAMGKHGFLGKQSLYDHSMRVPLVIAGCGLPKGERRDQMVYMQDIVPTMYEVAGVEAPEGTDFNSLIDIAKSKKAKSNYEYIYGAYIDKQRMIKDDRYKLFLINEAQKGYLFDLKSDPDEINNLFDDPKYKSVVERLSQAYLEYEASMNDKYDIKPSFPELF
ncbi:MAG: sulfatase-like hydrolase/transferase [Rikenellaceae bacterium]